MQTVASSCSSSIQQARHHPPQHSRPFLQGSNIHELHLHHAELHPSEWSTLLSLPFPKLAKLQLNRCRLGDCSELQVLGRLTNLQHLSLNHLQHLNYLLAQWQS
jgi:hypothetical protein